jgi:hypothetical protein
MLSFNEIWDIVLEKNPRMKEKKFDMTQDLLHKAMKMAYDQGEIAGNEKTKKIIDLANDWSKKGVKNDFGDIFGGMFGGEFGKK